MAEQEQERINFEAALELQRQLDERDEVPAEATQSQTIDWSDHVVLRLVQERFQDHPLEGRDLLLWGDLRMIFDPDEKNDIWMNQLD
ncbi:hypothetical protein Tco_0608006 [Tanacetum coccineum]